MSGLQIENNIKTKSMLFDEAKQQIWAEMMEKAQQAVESEEGSVDPQECRSMTLPGQVEEDFNANEAVGVTRSTILLENGCVETKIIITAANDDSSMSLNDENRVGVIDEKSEEQSEAGPPVTRDNIYGNEEVFENVNQGVKDLQERNNEIEKDDRVEKENEVEAIAVTEKALATENASNNDKVDVDSNDLQKENNEKDEEEREGEELAPKDETCTTNVQIDNDNEGLDEHAAQKEIQKATLNDIEEMLDTDHLAGTDVTSAATGAFDKDSQRIEIKEEKKKDPDYVADDRGENGNELQSSSQANDEGHIGAAEKCACGDDGAADCADGETTVVIKSTGREGQRETVDCAASSHEDKVLEDNTAEAPLFNAQIMMQPISSIKTEDTVEMQDEVGIGVNPMKESLLQGTDAFFDNVEESEDKNDSKLPMHVDDNSLTGHEDIVIDEQDLQEDLLETTESAIEEKYIEDGPNQDDLKVNYACQQGDNYVEDNSASNQAAVEKLTLEKEKAASDTRGSVIEKVDLKSFNDPTSHRIEAVSISVLIDDLQNLMEKEQTSKNEQHKKDIDKSGMSPNTSADEIGHEKVGESEFPAVDEASSAIAQTDVSESVPVEAETIEKGQIDMQSDSPLTDQHSSQPGTVIAEEHLTSWGDPLYRITDYGAVECLAANGSLTTEKASPSLPATEPPAESLKVSEAVPRDSSVSSNNDNAESESYEHSKGDIKNYESRPAAQSSSIQASENASEKLQLQTNIAYSESLNGAAGDITTTGSYIANKDPSMPAKISTTMPKDANQIKFINVKEPLSQHDAIIPCDDQPDIFNTPGNTNATSDGNKSDECAKKKLQNGFVDGTNYKASSPGILATDCITNSMAEPSDIEDGKYYTIYYFYLDLLLTFSVTN